MSRILRRPMFRLGGSTNEGIMTGLVDRKGYDNGTPSPAETYRDRYMEMLAGIQPPKPKFNLGQMGLNLASGRYAGSGLLQNIAGSAQDPYAAFVKADEARGGLEYQKKLMATKMGISRAEAEAVARAKAAGSGMQKDYSTDRKYFQLLEKYSEAPKDRYSKTITNLYPHGMAEFGSRIQDNAYKSKEGATVMQNLDGVVPHEIKGGQAQWQYGKMDAGAMYYHPQYKAFVQREPRTDDAPEQLVVYDPYTFQEVRRVNLQ